MYDQLDDTSWAILEALQENARISFAELGKHAGLTAPAVAERVRKMEDAGIISGYHASVNLSALGLPISVVIQMRMDHGRSREVMDLIRELPEITTCYNLTGNDCFMIVASVASVEHLERVLGMLTVHGQTTTSIILSSLVKRRSISGPINPEGETVNTHKNGGSPHA